MTEAKQPHERSLGVAYEYEQDGDGQLLQPLRIGLTHAFDLQRDCVAGGHVKRNDVYPAPDDVLWSDLLPTERCKRCPDKFGIPQPSSA